MARPRNRPALDDPSDRALPLRLRASSLGAGFGLSPIVKMFSLARDEGDQRRGHDEKCAERPRLVPLQPADISEFLAGNAKPACAGEWLVGEVGLEPTKA